MVSEIPSDRPITKTTASSDKAPPQAPVRLSKVQAEVSSSMKIATSVINTDAAPAAQEPSTKKTTTQSQSSSAASSTASPQRPNNVQQPSPPPPSGQKELYSATVIFNRQAGTGSPSPTTTSVVTQLTTDVIQRINQGLMTIIRITTDLPLLKGDQLIVNSSTVPRTTSSQAVTPHLELQQLHSIPSTKKIQQTIINLVRLLVPTQNSYSPLLNNILSLVSGKPELLRQLPPNIQQAIKQISQHIPKTESLRTADTVKQAIKHSGVLFESSLRSKSLTSSPSRSEPLKSGLPKSEPLTSELLKSKPLKSEPLKSKPLESQLRKHQSPSPTANTLTAKPNTRATPQPTNTNNASPPIDFKHQLLTLEKALLSATKTTSKPALNTSTLSDPLKVIQKTSITTNTTINSTTASTPGTSPTTIPTSTTGATPDYTAPSEKQQLQNLMLLAKMQQVTTETHNTKHPTNNVKITTEQAANITTPSKSHTSTPPRPLAIQTYQTASSPNTASLQGTPPLPGQYLMQAQVNVKATLKGNDIADALVKILLKQTQESISRLQLHQLSTVAAHVDDGAQITQAPLSFDLPILHFGQLTLFHFHIEEEAQKNDEEKETSADKKWNVSMGFDIEGLGAMFCELSLINTYVYVKFWAKEKDTVSRAKKHFDVLQKNLHQIGATVKELECIEGLPPQQESSIKPSLIDIET